MNTSAYADVGVPNASTMPLAQLLLAMNITGPAVIDVFASCGTEVKSAAVAVSPTSGAWSTNWNASASATPASGDRDTAINLTAPGTCPVASGVVGVLRGPGLPETGYNFAGWTSVDTVTVAVGTSLGLAVPVQQTLRNLARDIGNGFFFNGDYVFSIACRTGLDQRDFGSYDVSLRIDAAGFTALAAQPATLSIRSGSPVTVSVPPRAGPGVLSISVDGVLAVVATVTADAATVPVGATTSGLVVATLDPDAAGNLTATSSATITSPTSTTVQLTVSGASVASNEVPQGSSVDLVATVSPDTLEGRVTFLDSGQPLGSGAVVSGSATLTVTSLPVGSRQLMAVFRPQDSSGDVASAVSLLTVVASSTSTPSDSTSTAPTEPTTSQTSGTVAASEALTVTLSPNASGLANLPAPTLSSDGLSLQTSGLIDSVVITDTRSSAPGFTVSAQMSDLLGVTTGSVLSAGHVGFDPMVSGAGVIAASPVSGAAPGAPTLRAGLSIPRVVASAAPGFSGDATVGGRIILQVPTDVTPDAYEGYLVITVS